ncbi:MAG: hypothetical protein U5L09_14300 [Bacteroidales bacterium]|nr:hypothetical protein [Bacteroidales bacterium]
MAPEKKQRGTRLQYTDSEKLLLEVFDNKPADYAVGIPENGCDYTSQS